MKKILLVLSMIFCFSIFTNTKANAGDCPTPLFETITPYSGHYEGHMMISANCVVRYLYCVRTLPDGSVDIYISSFEFVSTDGCTDAINQYNADPKQFLTDLAKQAIININDLGTEGKFPYGINPCDWNAPNTYYHTTFAPCYGFIYHDESGNPYCPIWLIDPSYYGGLLGVPPNQLTRATYTACSQSGGCSQEYQICYNYNSGEITYTTTLINSFVYGDCDNSLTNYVHDCVPVCE